MAGTIELSAHAEYNERNPPSDAKRPYVARILGRAPGTLTFSREFLGRAGVLVDQPGLYERQIGRKKGGADQHYHVVAFVGNELKKSIDVGRPMALSIARRMDEGERIEDMVVLSGQQSRSNPDATVYGCELLSRGEARQKIKSATIESAIAHCWEALDFLPEREAKKVLTALRKRISPPKSKGAK